MNFWKSYSVQHDKHSLWFLFAMLCCCILILTTADIAFATTTATTDVFGSTLCNMVMLLNGNIARAIAIIAIFALGVMWLGGKVQWQVAASLVIAIVIIFKAPDIVQMMGVTGNVNCGKATVTS